MTMREEFTSWCSSSGTNPLSTVAWQAWQAAYAAGFAAARERGAEKADKRQGVQAMAIAMDIRAMKEDEETR